MHKGTYERVVGAVIITRACYIVGPRRPLSEIAARRSCSILRGAPRPPVLPSLKTGMVDRVRVRMCQRSFRLSVPGPSSTSAAGSSIDGGLELWVVGRCYGVGVQ